MTKANQKTKDSSRRKRKPLKNGGRPRKRARDSVEQEITSTMDETERDISATDDTSTSPTSRPSIQSIIDSRMVKAKPDIEEETFIVPFHSEESPNFLTPDDINESLIDRGSNFFWNARDPTFYHHSFGMNQIRQQRRTAYYLPVNRRYAGGRLGPNFLLSSYVSSRQPTSWMLASSTSLGSYSDFAPSLEEYDNMNGTLLPNYASETYADRGVDKVEGFENPKWGPKKVESHENQKWGPKKVESHENLKWGSKKLENVESFHQVSNIDERLTNHKINEKQQLLIDPLLNQAKQDTNYVDTEIIQGSDSNEPSMSGHVD